MEKPKLTEREEEAYQETLKNGTMEDMFRLGCIVGMVRGVREELRLDKEEFKNTKRKVISQLLSETWAQRSSS